MVIWRKTYWLLWSESWLTGERESDFWTADYLTISGGWFVNAFWSFLVTFWVNANYQNPTQDKLIIIRFQAWFLRGKKFNNYTCLICVYIFKDNGRVFSYCTFSLLKKSNHKYLCNRANYLIPWSLIRNKGAVCMKLVNFILWSFFWCVNVARFMQCHLSNQTLTSLLLWKSFVHVVKVHSNWL